MNQKTQSLDLNNQKSQLSNCEVNIKLPFRTYLNHHLRTPISFKGQGRTHQEFKDECDINRIMSHYMKTGILPEDTKERIAQFIDVTEHDFQNAQNMIAEARSMFEDLPSHIRSRFKNDPSNLIDFINDKNNWQEAQEMGLLAENAVKPISTPLPQTQTAPAPANAVPAQS